MAKGASYSNLMSRKMRRTILRSPLQFLTMTLILALASTLFSGLYASHLVFKNQINQAYEMGNIADISSTLSYSGDFVTEDPNADYELIKNTIGDAGQVEAQYHTAAKIHGLDANVSISDTYPTINKPIEVFNKTDKDTSDNYFYFCDTYLRVEMNYGKRETWIDKDGNYVPIEVQLDIANLKKRIKDDAGLNQVFEDYKKVPNEVGTHALVNDYFVMKVTPTGNMSHPENIASNTTQPYTFITTRKFLEEPVTNALKGYYRIDGIRAEFNNPDTPEARKASLGNALNILDNSREEIIDKYWNNNRCITRLNNRSQADTYRDKIASAFINKSSKNNLLFNVSLEDTVANQQLATDTMQSIQLCCVFPPIFFLVAVLIVLTTISQIILKERKEIGTLKAIGASNRSILTYYMGLTGVISLVGVALGLIAGPLLMPLVLNIKYKMLYNLPAMQYIFPTTISIIMTLAVLIITMLVAFLIARREAKALPVTSMHPKPIAIKRKKLKEVKAEDKTHKLCFNMAVRNIFCSASRSIMVIIGVLGCTSLLCCGFGIDDSVQKGINNDSHMFFNTDSMIYFSNQTVNTLTSINDMTIDDKKAVTEFEPFGYLPVTSNKVGVLDETFSTYVYSIPRRSSFFNLGYQPYEDKIAVSNKIAKALNVREGDSINYTFLGKKYTGKIGKVLDVFYMHGIYVDGESTSSPQWLTYPTCAYARFNKEIDENKILDKIRSVQGVASVLDHEALTKRVDEVSSSIDYITITIKVFAILLAVVALYNLALLNFKENIRNIATMKVLGFNRKEVAESLFFEIIILSAVGALIGLTLGWPLTRLTLGINQVPMCEFFYYVSALSFVLSLIITIGVTAIINIFVGLRSKQVKMVESLKSVE